MATVTDDDLVRAYLAGDLRAFETLFDRYERRILGFVASLGGRPAQVEDAAQTTWLKVVQELPRYRPMGRFKSWLFRIAQRTWLDSVRSAWERKKVTLPESVDGDFEGVPIEWWIDDRASPRESAATVETRDALYQALDALPDSMRQTVLMRIDAEMTFREIGEAMGCPLGTALWRMKEAQKRLRAKLGFDHEQ